MSDDPLSLQPSLILSTCRPTWAEINLSNLVHNLQVTRAMLGPNVAVLAAVKGDAYGHGAIRCAQVLEQAGVEWFGVALPEEGVALRQAGISKPILCLAGFWEGQETLLIENQLTPAAFRLETLESLDRAARLSGKQVAYHLKVDTGMGRLGVPSDNLGGFLEHAELFEHLRLDGVMAHFAAADDSNKRALTEEQFRRFDEAVGLLYRRGHSPAWVHQANSAVAHSFPSARGNMARLGGILYGLWRDVTDRGVPPLDWRPVMSVRTRIALVKTVPEGTSLGYGFTFTTQRQSRIATLPIGYEDGLRRALSNRGRVLVNGCIAPIVGRISMDLTLVDVTEIPSASAGDEVVVIGRDGAYSMTAEEVAELAGTISYEITSGISGRVPRVHLGPA